MSIFENYHVEQAVKLGDYNVGRNGSVLIKRNWCKKSHLLNCDLV